MPLLSLSLPTPFCVCVFVSLSPFPPYPSLIGTINIHICHKPPPILLHFYMLVLYGCVYVGVCLHTPYIYIYICMYIYTLIHVQIVQQEMSELHLSSTTAESTIRTHMHTHTRVCVCTKPSNILEPQLVISP
ncbi:Hypothetical predicted protein [Octopus vulgaris]|uniref:Uncharacterized protein n=1 Tax=Octopus vulgaris TaxID=6645 RepID=A0AA36BRK6_OCTVU|nr:Hypothetical predicted protein [Octopus vulgaris]